MLVSLHLFLVTPVHNNPTGCDSGMVVLVLVLALKFIVTFQVAPIVEAIMTVGTTIHLPYHHSLLWSSSIFFYTSVRCTYHNSTLLACLNKKMPCKNQRRAADIHYGSRCNNPKRKQSSVCHSSSLSPPPLSTTNNTMPPYGEPDWVTPGDTTVPTTQEAGGGSFTVPVPAGSSTSNTNRG